MVLSSGELLSTSLRKTPFTPCDSSAATSPSSQPSPTVPLRWEVMRTGRIFVPCLDHGTEETCFARPLGQATLIWKRSRFLACDLLSLHSYAFSQVALSRCPGRSLGAPFISPRPRIASHLARTDLSAHSRMAVTASPLVLRPLLRPRTAATPEAKIPPAR